MYSFNIIIFTIIIITIIIFLTNTLCADFLKYASSKVQSYHYHRQGTRQCERHARAEIDPNVSTTFARDLCAHMWVDMLERECLTVGPRYWLRLQTYTRCTGDVILLASLPPLNKSIQGIGACSVNSMQCLHVIILHETHFPMTLLLHGASKAELSFDASLRHRWRLMWNSRNHFAAIGSFY